MASRVDEVGCRYCGEEDVYMDVKEEHNLYKIGAQCGECSHDYGVIEKVSRSDIDQLDELYETGEESIHSLLE